MKLVTIICFLYFKEVYLYCWIIVKEKRRLLFNSWQYANFLIIGGNNVNKQIDITVYGANQICASCVNLPSSLEQFEWIKAAITRKYGEGSINFKYIDIFSPPANAEYQAFAKRVVEEDMFYPLVLVNDEIVGEGNPKLKTIKQALETRGITPVEEG